MTAIQLSTGYYALDIGGICTVGIVPSLPFFSLLCLASQITRSKNAISGERFKENVIIGKRRSNKCFIDPTRTELATLAETVVVRRHRYFHYSL